MSTTGVERYQPVLSEVERVRTTMRNDRGRQPCNQVDDRRDLVQENVGGRRFARRATLFREQLIQAVEE